MSQPTPSADDHAGSSDQPYAARPEQPYTGQPGQPYTGQPGPDQAYGSQPHPGQGYAAPGQQYQGYANPGYGSQPYPGGYYPATRPNNTMAVVSVISGALGLTLVPFLGSIVAIITGHIARREIARTGEEGGTMALIGLILGYLAVGVGALLVVGWLLLVMSVGVFGFAAG